MPRPYNASPRCFIFRDFAGPRHVVAAPRAHRPTGAPTTNGADTRPQHAVALQQKQKTPWQYHLRLRCDTRRATTCRGRKVDAQAVAAPGGLPAQYSRARHGAPLQLYHPQLFRHAEDDVFFLARQLLCAGGPLGVQVGDNLAHQHIRCRGACGDADILRALQPG